MVRNSGTSGITTLSEAQGFSRRRKSACGGSHELRLEVLHKNRRDPLSETTLEKEAPIQNSAYVNSP